MAVSLDSAFHNAKAAQFRRNIRLFVFTLKLACLFLGCSVPYKIAMLVRCVGAWPPRPVVSAASFLRVLYHVTDGWLFCTNEELMEAMLAQITAWRSRA